MSPLFFVAFGLSGLVVAGLILLISRRVKHNALRWLGIGVSVLLFFPLTLPLLSGLAWLGTSYHYDVAPQTVPIKPPATATAVSYMRAPLLGRALVVEFTCSEGDFLAWMKSKGWQPEPIKEPENVMRLSHQHRGRSGSLEQIRVGDGYHFDDYDREPGKYHDDGVTVVYDRSTGTGFICGTTF